MRAEGTGLILGFATLFLAMMVQVGTFWYKNGRASEKLDTVVKTVGEMKKDNSEGHVKIFDCINETSVSVAKIGERVEAINSTVKVDSSRITELEKEH